MTKPAYLHRAFFLVLFLGLLAPQVIPQIRAREILNGSDLTDGFDMGHNTGKGTTGWASKESDCFKMAFPPDQGWAALFVTVGEPTDSQRPSLDFSAYNTLSIEMKGMSGGETIEIGIKSNTQPDTGKENKITVSLTTAWEEYTFPLKRFLGNGLRDLTNLYVVTEFVYNGKRAQTVYFRNIKYLTR